MIRQYECGNIQKFVATKETRRTIWNCSLLAFAAIAASFGPRIFFSIAHHPSPASFSQISETTLAPGQSDLFVMLPNSTTKTIPSSDFYGKDQMDLGTWQEWEAALKSARAEWSRVLGMPAPNPSYDIDRSRMCSGEDSIACADPLRMQIWIRGANRTHDKRTVMLHEMGHLLGVPHILDDALMDWSYQEKVAHPTPAAIALAKLNYHPRRQHQQKAH